LAHRFENHSCIEKDIDMRLDWKLAGQGIGLLAMGIAVLAIGGSSTAAEKLQYNRDVRPILADTCFRCHGPDGAARKADLRVDQREAAIQSHAIVPGKPDESELIRRIFSADADELMPPPSSHKVLTDEQKQLLRQWIAEGAEYQQHWSFIAPVRPPLPDVPNDAWKGNPIDRFVWTRMHAAGLEPAPPADRRTLARRVSLDLTGLPPDPKRVEEFVNDASADAYEKFVQKLLDSPQWGEHRARYWLDYARYADTHGVHFDNYREMWSYRDWLIDAFNRNLSFDQFTRISLAGDLLPNATREDRIGSGFNRCNMTTNEGGIIDEEYVVLYARDRTESVARVWLGLTANCSVCHDHKFDPLPQREFYEMSAFFNNTTQGARDGNIKDTPPVIVVPLKADQTRWDALQGELPAARGQVDARRRDARAEFDAWVAKATPDEFRAEIPGEGLALRAPLDEGTGNKLRVEVGGQPREIEAKSAVAWQPGYLTPSAVSLNGGSVLEVADAADFEKDQAFSVGAWVRLAGNDSLGAIAARMDNRNAYRGWDFWMEGRRIGTHIVSKWADDALKVVSATQVAPDRWTHVTVTYDGSAKAAGVQVYFDGQAQKTNVQADTLKGSIHTDVAWKIGQRESSEPISGAAVQDLRIYRRALSAAEVESLARSSRHAALLAKPADKRTAEETTELYDWWLRHRDASFKSLVENVSRLEREEQDIRARGTIAHVMEERKEPATAFVLFRGEYDKRRDQVTPDTFRSLPPFPADAPRNRLGLANWLLMPEHPLTARVTVNRFWQEVFGTGIVRTTGDFGIAGELPANPELLDWLAVEFRESGWDVKRLFRLMVTSAAYCQSPSVTPAKLESDPENRLISRGPRFRMDAEMVRDYALAASGLLVSRIGGPSVKPYQPPGVWEAIAMNVSNTRSYERGNGEDLYRRSLYTFWKRMAPPASLDTFNAPSREFCVVRRERTNTPLQALVTLNDEQFVEAARHLAERALKEGGSAVDGRIQYIARNLLLRDLREDELAVARRSADDLLKFYASRGEDAGKLVSYGASKPDVALPKEELAAWTMLANELMNLDEVLSK
jgi:hypothetical protein